jgi:recombination protein RecA
MTADRKHRLMATVAALQQRWGAKAVRRLGQEALSPVDVIATGFPALDEALGCGGIPRGRMTELRGVPSAGAASLALPLAANAQADGVVVYLDLNATLDPAYAARLGVRLEQLLVVRPADTPQAFDIAQDLLFTERPALVVFDAPLIDRARRSLAQENRLDRLVRPLSQARTALLFVTTMPASSPATLLHYAALRLHMERSRWLYHQQDICGYEAEIQIVKNKLGPAGREVRVEILFDR